MTALIFYRPGYGPEEREVKEFEDRMHQNKVETQLIDFDSSDATHKREIYDVVDHPTVVLVRLDGSLVQKWTTMPLASEISYLAHN